MPRFAALILWMLLPAGVLMAADEWTHVSSRSEPGLPGDEIQFLEEDAKGRVWIGTLSGAAYYQDGKFRTLKTQEGKPLPLKAWDILGVGEGRFWIGHAGGAALIELDTGKVRGTLRGYTVAPILPFNKTTLWAIGKHGGTENNVLFENKGADWQPVEQFKEMRPVDLYRDARDLLWLVIDGNGVYEIDPAAEPAAAPHHLEGLNITSIVRDSRKRVWCGLWGRGVRMFDGTNWHEHITKEKSAILAIQEDTEGGIWVATSANGVWRFDGKSWTNHLADEGSVNLLAATADGRVWVSSQQAGGLRYWDDGRWVVSLPGPLPIRCLIRTRDGAIWAGGILDGLHILRNDKTE